MIPARIEWNPCLLGGNIVLKYLAVCNSRVNAASASLVGALSIPPSLLYSVPSGKEGSREECSHATSGGFIMRRNWRREKVRRKGERDGRTGGASVRASYITPPFWPRLHNFESLSKHRIRFVFKRGCL